MSKFTLYFLAYLFPSVCLSLQCVLTLRDSDATASEAIADTFCFCSWNNQCFSACTIEDLQQQISIVPSNEIRNYFKVLTEILVIHH